MPFISGDVYEPKCHQATLSLCIYEQIYRHPDNVSQSPDVTSDGIKAHRKFLKMQEAADNFTQHICNKHLRCPLYITTNGVCLL